jgi:general secretion pathway protein D
MKTLRALLFVAVGVGSLLLPAQAGTQADPRAKISAKLKSIKLPKVQLTGVTISEAVQYFQIKSRELDPAKVGVNIIAKLPPEVQGQPITMELTDVPLEFALKTAADLAGLRLRLEPHAVLVTSITDDDQQFYTRTFTVPPNFLDAGANK